MTPEELDAQFAPFYESFVNLATLTDKERPLYLAHYTSLEVLEKIIQSNELWFSNPLFMNDHSEMRGGIFESMKVFREIEQDHERLIPLTQVHLYVVSASGRIAPGFSSDSLD
jgi:hypothetical protein